MDRATATIWAVSAGLVALLVCIAAYGLGVGEWLIFVGLALAPVVTALAYRELRS